MNGGKDHTDQRHHDQYNVQQTEYRFAVIFFQLKKTKRNNEQEQSVCNHYLAP